MLSLPVTIAPVPLVLSHIRPNFAVALKYIRIFNKIDDNCCREREREREKKLISQETFLILTKYTVNTFRCSSMDKSLKHVNI